MRCIALQTYQKLDSAVCPYHIIPISMVDNVKQCPFRSTEFLSTLFATQLWLSAMASLGVTSRLLRCWLCRRLWLSQVLTDWKVTWGLAILAATGPVNCSTNKPLMSILVRLLCRSFNRLMCGRVVVSRTALCFIDFVSIFEITWNFRRLENVIN